jgi:maintenance of morphology protein 1
MSLSSEGVSTSTSFLGIRLTFTQGFLAGQLSVVLIALVAIRYIIFEDSRSASQSNRSNRAKTNAQADTLRKGRKSVSNKDGLDKVDIANTMADILSKVKYEIDSHAGESIDWLNVIVAQALAGYREDVLAGGWSADRRRDEAQKTAREWMEEILNARTVGKGMSFLVSLPLCL